MELPAGHDRGEFMELRLKDGSWERNGIPSTGCWMRREQFGKILERGGTYDADDIIYGLMDWLDVTDEPVPAQRTLRSILDRHYPDDGRTCGRVHFLDENGVDFIFHVGPIDLAKPLVAWQRKDWFIAAVQPAEEEGRIVAGAPDPITLQVARRIRLLSVLGDMGGRIDSYEAARNCSLSGGSSYHVTNGSVVAHNWEYGLDTRPQNGELLYCGDVDHPSSDGWLSPNQLVRCVAIASGFLG